MEQESVLKKINNAAILWNKTKDPQYKDLWYKLIREWNNGPNYIQRRVVSIDTSHKADNGRYSNNS